ncbi:DUF2177 family protein [Rhizobium laguerreae]|uniref:DUF2177 family protein n=1 Tax=Rhizobium laguerreae TaxID=1076926 RepID=A0A6N9ZQL5_9HYPH|nr:DUF2177 family protein [Rhizobium laguerreae]
MWLGLIARSFYRDQLGSLMLPSPNPAASIATAFLHGAILGPAAYGTYDITNLATLRNWPLATSLDDMAWGTALTALTAAGGYLAVRFFG